MTSRQLSPRDNTPKSLHKPKTGVYIGKDIEADVVRLMGIARDIGIKRLLSAIIEEHGKQHGY